MQLRTRFLILLVGLAQIAHAQTSRFPPINLYNGDPTGNVCTSPLIQQSSTNGKVYSCQSGHMNLISGAAFDGGVVTNPITAPSYTLAGCPAGQVIKGDGTGCVALTAGTAAGSNTQLQYNNGGNFGATTWTWDGAYMNSAADLPAGHQLASANAAVTTYSVLAYGAKGDELFRTASGASFQYSMTSGSAVLTGISTTFTAADVGKWVRLYGWNNLPFAVVAYTGQPNWTTSNVAQIIGFTNATHVTLSKTAAANSSGSLAYGTDNSPAYNACQQDAMTKTGGGICIVPPGSFLFATSSAYVQTAVSDDGSYGTSAGGSGATATTTLTGGSVSACTITAGGSGYTASSTLQATLTGGCTGVAMCGQAFIHPTTNASGVVTGCNVVYGGFGYVSAPTVTVRALGGDGATATASVSGAAITTPVIGAGGSGYPASSATAANWYALQGTTDCAAKGNSNLTGVVIVASGTATSNASGALISTAIVTAATGCSTGTPVIIFGDQACNSGTAGSPVWGQCANMSPLDPEIYPVHVFLNNSSGVSYVGQSGAHGAGATLDGTWDGQTVDFTQPAIIGGYLGGSDLKNFNINNGEWCAQFWNNPNYTRIADVTFGCGVGLYTWATDLNSVFDNLTFTGSAGWVNGGTWQHRSQNAAGGGGFFDAPLINNLVARPPAYGGASSLQGKLDDLFATHIWHTEYSVNSGNFLETCKQPQAANQRQTGHSLSLPQGANTHCYPGITSFGMVILERDGRATGATQFNSLTAKQISRNIFCCDVGGMQITNFGCEACTSISGTNDPYRNATQIEGSVKTNDISGSSTPGAFAFVNGLNDSTGTRTVAYCAFSINKQGIPTGLGWNNLSCTATNAEVSYNPFFRNAISFQKEVTIGTAGVNSTAYPIYITGPFAASNLNGCTGKIQSSTLGGSIFGGDNSSSNSGCAGATYTDVFDWSNSLIRHRVAVQSDVSLKLLSGGTAMTGNQGTGALLQHSTGALTNGNFIKADANGNTVDSGIPATATVADTTITIASFAIPANTCYGSAGSTTPATVSMTNLTTAMSVIPGYSSNPTAITGWGTVGGLNLIIWPSSANTASYCVNNSTAGSITGGAITFNLVAR